MFNKSLSETLEIIGTILAVGIIVFGLIWGLLTTLGVNVSDVFNNIQFPS